MRHLIALAMAGVSIIAYRWGMGISSPRADRFYVLRAIGWAERMTTRLDAALARLKVWCVDRLELDRAVWVKLRAQYVPEMS